MSYLGAVTVLSYSRLRVEIEEALIEELFHLLDALLRYYLDILPERLTFISHFDT